MEGGHARANANSARRPTARGQGSGARAVGSGTARIPPELYHFQQIESLWEDLGEPVKLDYLRKHSGLKSTFYRLWANSRKPHVEFYMPCFLMGEATPSLGDTSRGGRRLGLWERLLTSVVSHGEDPGWSVTTLKAKGWSRNHCLSGGGDAPTGGQSCLFWGGWLDSQFP